MNPTLVTDPICNMTIDPSTAAGTSVCAGRTYAFCSISCKKTFDAAPEKYVGADSAAAKTSSCCGGNACHV